MKRARTAQVLFGITIVSMVAISIVTYRSMERFQQEHQAMRAGHLGLRFMESMRSSVKDSESALRDFRRTQDTMALKALKRARAELALQMEAAALLGHAPESPRIIGQLRDTLAAAFADLGVLDSMGLTAGDTLLKHRVDEALNDLVATRKLVSRATHAEEEALRRSREQQERTGLATPILLMTCSLLALVAMAVLFVRSMRSGHKAARAERETERTQDQLKRVLDSSVSGIMAFRSVRDGTGRIGDFEWTLVNHQAEVMLGRPADQLIGARLLTVLPATATTGLFARFTEVVDTGRPVRLDGVHDINGLGLHLDVHGVKLGDGLVVTYTDVSDRERQRSILRESERMALTGKIARTVAHEVRNPLTNVVLALDQIKEEAGPGSPVGPYAEIVHRNVDRIAQLITEMLESSKPREVVRTPCTMSTIMSDAVDLVRDRIELQRMTLVVELAPDLPPVAVDRNEMKLALCNIIINAIEAMEEGKGRLRVSASLHRNHVKVVVNDNGRGMTVEERSRLFDPFYTGRPGGMGLGLTAARSILNSHDVHLEVASELGEGTSFTLLFPTVPTN